jgi:hypothetical protein
MPEAEQKSIREYTPVSTLKRAEWRYYTDVGGDTPPDAGSEGWFITDDSLDASPVWTRMTGDFAGSATGTTSGSFTADSDDSEASYIYFNFGTGGAGLRLDIIGTTVEVNHGAGWVSLATGAGSFIEDTYSAEDYRLVVDSVTGNLKYIKDFGGTPETIFEVTPTGDIIAYGDVEPDTDEGTALGTDTKKWANIYCGNVVYTQDITFSPDGGTTVDGKLETVNNVVYPEGIAFGFQDD